MADQFTANINDLLIIGRMDLLLMATTYGKVNNAVALTAGSQAAAFQVSADGPASLITALWQELRDDLQNVLGHSAENLFSAAQTVVHIAEVYEQTDTESGQAILKAAWDSGNPSGTLAGERIPADQPPVIQIAG
ncbi:hypothetical protein [Actinoplanes sp. L3-i22]|uniref:hypothetical protein n=1 Tax=Actinoplanes sp. L3-i22 TaxID=2836373 RepID=UPI001C76F884|nr:hypothetical protein [Actinoplanes sp. L3-i22]BCY13240.1 hypothetical protein L3i22_083280 [Actinoplanes sp. L3-i22]